MRLPIIERCILMEAAQAKPAAAPTSAPGMAAPPARPIKKPNPEQLAKVAAAKKVVGGGNLKQFKTKGNLMASTAKERMPTFAKDARKIAKKPMATGVGPSAPMGESRVLRGILMEMQELGRKATQKLLAKVIGTRYQSANSVKTEMRKLGLDYKNKAVLPTRMSLNNGDIAGGYKVRVKGRLNRRQLQSAVARGCLLEAFSKHGKEIEKTAVDAYGRATKGNLFTGFVDRAAKKLASEKLLKTTGNAVKALPPAPPVKEWNSRATLDRKTSEVINKRKLF